MRAFDALLSPAARSFSFWAVEPFKEKMQSLTSELSGLFAESIRLQDEIREKLEAIGYEI